MSKEINQLSKKNRKKIEKFVFNTSRDYFKYFSLKKIYFSDNIFPKSFEVFKDEWIKIIIPKEFLNENINDCNYIYVDKNSICNDKRDFFNVDWIRVIFIFLSCFREYESEKKKIKINSYSFKLKKVF